MIGKKGVTLPQLRDLRTEIGRTRRQATRLAGRAGNCGCDPYQAALATIFESWLADASERRQLVCFAAATEMGLLLEWHVDSFHATAMQSGQEVLRVLYWTVMRRWNMLRRKRVGENQCSESIDLRRAAPAILQPICGKCTKLQQEPRRASGHDQLHTVSLEAQRRYLSKDIVLRVREYRCHTCNAKWLMSCHAGDPFAGWTLRGLGDHGSVSGAHMAAHSEFSSIGYRESVPRSQNVQLGSTLPPDPGLATYALAVD